MADRRDFRDPGPIDPIVLYDQARHRSTRVWETRDLSTLQCRNSELTKGRDSDLPYRIQHRLQTAGFYSLYHIGKFQLDHGLITALVERWRPETHTFHMVPGECTITLQDVEVITGLRIDGPAVVGDDENMKMDDYNRLLHELLGDTPPPNAYKTRYGSEVKLSWLRRRFQQLPEDANDVVLDQYTRAHILILLVSYVGGKNQGYVRLWFLPLLRNLRECSKMSWGSAILATLYKELCNASMGSKDIAGPLRLLQIWAWLRFPQIGPVLDGPLPVPEPTMGLPHFAFGTRYLAAPYAFNQLIDHNNLKRIREMFDTMTSEQIIWRPYDDHLPSLPVYNTRGRHIWLACVPLICYNVVEYHRPDRVLRQFGKIQYVPGSCVQDAFHLTTRKGKKKIKWSEKLGLQLDEWDDRANRLAVGDDGPMLPDSDYFDWYSRITRRFINPPDDIPPRRGHRSIGNVLLQLVYALGKNIKYSTGRCRMSGEEVTKMTRSTLALAGYNPDLVEQYTDDVDDYQDAAQEPHNLGNQQMPEHSVAVDGSHAHRRHNIGESSSSRYHDGYGDAYRPGLFNDTSEDMLAHRASYSDAYYPSVPYGDMSAHRMSYSGPYYPTLPPEEFTPTPAPNLGISGWYQGEGSTALPRQSRHNSRIRIEDLPVLPDIPVNPPFPQPDFDCAWDFAPFQYHTETQPPIEPVTQEQEDERPRRQHRRRRPPPVPVDELEPRIRNPPACGTGGQLCREQRVARGRR